MCPKRERSSFSQKNRTVAQLLTLLDGAASQTYTRSNLPVFVFSTTSDADQIDIAVRRSGRLEIEIELGIPTESERLTILQQCSKYWSLTSDVSLMRIAENTFGFVGADLKALCQAAALNALRRRQIQHSSSAQIECQDFAVAMSEASPSIKKTVSIQVSSTNWSKIGGYEEVKSEVREAIEWPLKFPEAFVRLGISPPKGVLLYGPPGCSKTTLAKAVATMCHATFISINGASIYSPYVGSAEAIVRNCFKQARVLNPSVIFLDELDAIVGMRSLTASGGVQDGGVQERVLSTLLNEMDGIENSKNILVLAATNRPDLIDKALLRPGRIDKFIYVGPPDRESRRHILEIHSAHMPLHANVSLDELSRQTEDYSGADLENICREAALISLRESLNSNIVEMRHFLRALEGVAPSLKGYKRAEFV
eukprot:TRINITY_DN678_c0_g1_i1.p1 TRINITY_DN678_c0_g1~~TRINITY_DN678_c0_g1_i1.p1  ORF type:complete len:424 (+),score=44.36 TRINITY_DN678_c0_g1_i1:434-1705(+)